MLSANQTNQNVKFHPYSPISIIDNTLDEIKNIVTKHPKAAIITGIALTALGTLLISLAATSLFIPPVSIILAVNGAALTAWGVTTLAFTAFKWRHVLTYLFAVPMLSAFGIQYSSPENPHRFTDNTCAHKFKPIGKLHHENEQPVLELYTEDPYEMGLAQGYLLGKEINEAFEEVLKPMMGLCSTLTGDFSGKFYEQQAKQITIPEAYKREIEGMITGGNAWALESGRSFDLTFEQAIEAHKLTDIYKAIGCQRIFGIPGFNAFGCSTAVIKKDDEVAVARTLDWPSLGKMGDFAYIRRHKANGRLIEMQTFAGIVGALTAFNNKGLVAIINENSTVSKAGTPYAMLTRQIIEQNDNVEEAEVMINRDDYQPASSHHLTLANAYQANIYQMVLEDGRKYIKRELDFSQKNSFIAVTNHTMTEQNEVVENTICDPTSMARYKAITDTLTSELDSDFPLAEVVNKTLKAVNTMDTVATAHFSLSEEKNQKVRAVNYTNNNFWAAKLL